jgi:Ser/Thr protein kinase RdoA (MazF antagonist)
VTEHDRQDPIRSPGDQRTPPAPRAGGPAPAGSPPVPAPTIEPGELASVLSRVDLGEVLLVSPVALGRPDSPKSLLRTSRGHFLVRRLAPRPTQHERAAINALVSQRLRDAGLLVPRVVFPSRNPDPSGTPLIRAGAHWFEVREFIPARACEPTLEDAQRLGDAAARIHGALADIALHIPLPVWRPASPDALRTRLAPGPGLDRAAAGSFARLADLGALAARTLAELGVSNEPAQLIHADLHPGNIVFAGNDPVVLDVESAQLGPTIADVASAALHVWLRAKPTDNHAPFTHASPPGSMGLDATAALFRGYHSRRGRAFSPAAARAAPWLMVYAAACEIADASVQKQGLPLVQGLAASVRRVLDEVLERAGAIAALARAG